MTNTFWSSNRIHISIPKISSFFSYLLTRSWSVPRQLLNIQCRCLVGIKGRQRRRWRHHVTAGAGAGGHSRVSTNIWHWQRISRLIRHIHRCSRRRGRGDSWNSANISAVLGMMGWCSYRRKEKLCIVILFFCSMKSNEWKECWKWIWWMSAFELNPAVPSVS